MPRFCYDCAMDWDLPAIVLDTRPYGDVDLIATVMTEDHGAHKGLVRGGASRAQSGLWQAGNFVQTRWQARTEGQLGGFRGEMIHATAASVMDDALSLAMLSAVCAVAEDSLPEREPHGAVFQGLIHLLPRLVLAGGEMAELVRWETVLLADLGFALDLSVCAMTGERENLAFVSPRTGRAVTAAAAGGWTGKLLPLPAFLTVAAEAGQKDFGPEDSGPGDSGPGEWRDGLRLTGHFLARDVFGARHKPLPQARRMLYDRVAALAADSENTDAG